MNAAIYLRVSSTDGRQDEANQEPDTRRICEARGWPVAPEHVFRERESGVKKRPVWAACMESARRGHVGAVVLYSLSRCGRNRVQISADIASLLSWQTRVVSVRESWIDNAEPKLRELLIQVVGWVAEGERDELIARTRAGLARARANGVQFGPKRKIPEDLALAMGRAYLRGGFAAARAVPGAERYPRNTVRSTAEREADALVVIHGGERV